MCKIKPPSERAVSLFIIFAVVLVLIGYVLIVHYPTVRFVALAVGHRITAQNISTILSAVSWPCAVIISVLVLRDALRKLLNRMSSASVGGEKGPLINFASEGQPAPPPTQSMPNDVEGISFERRVRNGVANTYWLASDLMAIFHSVLQRDSRDTILGVFRQANHHMKVLRLKDTPLYSRFHRLYDYADKSLDSDWTDQRRIEVAREVHSIMGGIGRLIEATQPGFSGDAQTSINL